MIQVDQHEGSYLSICKHYKAIYDTPSILEDSSKWQQVESRLVLGRVLLRKRNGLVFHSFIKRDCFLVRF